MLRLTHSDEKTLLFYWLYCGITDCGADRVHTHGESIFTDAFYRRRSKIQRHRTGGDRLRRRVSYKYLV